jgi:hypothetical protein
MMMQQVRRAFCWSHVRRKFYELADNSPVATELLRRIALLYAIEDETRGSSAEQRRALRVERARVVVDDPRLYLDVSIGVQSGPPWHPGAPLMSGAGFALLAA